MPTYSPRTFYDAPNPLTPLSAANINAELQAIAAAIGSGVGALDSQPAVRCYSSTTQAVANSTLTGISFDTNRYDSDTQHFTSAANLTGTVAKTNGSATLTGTGTAFTTQLSIGQAISVPGGASEVRIVTNIASDTSLTVSANFANTASGQTAARVNTPIVARTAGVYVVTGHVEFPAAASGQRLAALTATSGVAAGVTIAEDNRSGIDASTPVRISITGEWKAAQWDFFQFFALQSSGGSLTLPVSTGWQQEFSAVRVAAG